MQRSNPRPIDSITTDELIDELVSRCNPAVFIGYKTEGDKDEVVFWRLSGNDAVCYGLCHQLAYNIQMMGTDDLLTEEEETE